MAACSDLTAEQFVRIAYQTLLSRDAEPAAVADKAGRMVSGHADPRMILEEILRSPEFGSQVGYLLARIGGNYRLLNSQAQYGELDILLCYLLNRAVVTKYVVDVGARGRERSNSFDLMKFFGWKGLLIEANPRLGDQIRNEFGGLDYELVQSAVSDYEGRGVFTLGANDDVSSLDPAAAEVWGQTRGSIEVEVQRLPRILSDRKVALDFGLLSIDIEGQDVRVFNDLVLNSDYRPRFVLIEASQDFSVTSLAQAGACQEAQAAYRIVGQTRSNLILAFVASQ
jgi:FkbM family methyltransferase